MAYGDTPNFSATNLCKTCRNAQIIEGAKYDQVIVYCAEAPMNAQAITFPVVKCSTYEDKSTPELFEMQKIAYRFSVDDRKKTMGFLSPKEWKDKHGERS